MEDLRYNIESNHESLAAALRKSPNMAYQKVNELALFVGSRYGVNLQLHFPAAAKISPSRSSMTLSFGKSQGIFGCPSPTRTVTPRGAGKRTYR